MYHGLTPDGVEQSAFDALKQLITSMLILVLPDQTKSFQLEMDASACATSAILSQLCDDEKWRPVGFVSKSLSETECNYAILLSVGNRTQRGKGIVKEGLEVNSNEYFC